MLGGYRLQVGADAGTSSHYAPPSEEARLSSAGPPVTHGYRGGLGWEVACPALTGERIIEFRSVKGPRLQPRGLNLYERFRRPGADRELGRMRG